MKKIMKLITVFLLLIGTCMTQNVRTVDAANDAVYERVMARKKLVIGTSAPFAPYEFYDRNNQIQGLDVELGKKLASELGVDIEFVNLEFKVLIGELKTGHIDMIISDISPTEERSKEIDFSDIYYTSNVAVLVKKADVEKYNTNAGFEGKTLGAQAGTIQETIAKEDLKAGNVVALQEIPTLAVNLVNGKLDGLVVEDVVGAELVDKYKELTMAPEKLAAGDAAIGISKNSPVLLEKSNKVIQSLKANGEIQTMFHTASKLSQETTKNDEQSNAGDKVKEYGMLFLQGIGITVGISFFAILIGFFFGLLFVFGSRLKHVGFIFKTIVSFLRGTPLLVQLFLFAYVVFGLWIPLDKVIGNQGYLLAAALCALGLNSGAYISEIMRAGINAVDQGQVEAARSLGLSSKDTMKSIILPQAIKNILPALGNEFVVIIKESAIVAIIGVVDVMKASQIMTNKTFDPFVPLIIAAGIYYILTFIMSQLVAILERRLAISDRG